MTTSRLAQPFANPANALQLTHAELAGYDGQLRSAEDITYCRRQLQMGFFFDGTRNNLVYDEPSRTHSNVARLYQAYDSEPRADEGHQYRYKTYAAGVGTEFWKQVGDPGVGLHAAAGAAAGWGGEARINWALLQLQNDLHRHWLGEPLSYEADDLAYVKQMSTDVSLDRMRTLPRQTHPQPKSEADVTLRSEIGTQQALQAIFSTHWRDSNTDGRRRVLAARREELRSKLLRLIPKRLPEINGIRLYVFGFSRGATAARVFVNWLRDLCDQPHGPMTVCGLPMRVEFLGLFDTVASVGAAQGVLDDLATGHGGWAQRRDLRIPGGDMVAQCLHLVAAHEVRGSFPVDLAHGPQVTEEVFPGVHSDLGGGYAPGEQGRGSADADKLSQLPLARMYRAALAAGVPLVHVASASGPVKASFEVSPALVRRFNAYLAQCRETTGATPALMKSQYRLYLRWRRLRLGAHAPSTLGARQDIVDILTADDELRQEWELLQRLDGLRSLRNSTWLRNGYLGMLDELGIGVVRAWAYLKVAVLGGVASPAWAAFDDVPGGYLASVSPAYASFRTLNLARAQEKAAEKKYAMWREVSPAWKSTQPLHADLTDLFDRHVHDSRAWFKPLGDDDDVWEWKQRNAIRGLLERERAWKAHAAAPAPVSRARGAALAPPDPPLLSRNEHAALAKYRERLAQVGARDGELPSRALPLQTSGREISALWGYLRWRGMFEDRYAQARNAYPELAGATRETLASRKRALERQLRVTRTALERASRTLSASVPAGWGLAAGGMSADHVRHVQAMHAQADAVEAELAAVEQFIAELGPQPWGKLW